MVIRYISGTSIVSADNTPAIIAATDDQIIIAAGAVRGATGNGSSYAITAAAGASQIDILVQGMLFGMRGIDLADATGANSIVVAEGGYVAASQAVLYLQGTEISVRNSGVIEGLDSAGSGSGFTVVYSTADTTRIFNDGRITSRNFANAISTSSSLGTTLVNTGVIESLENVTTGNPAVTFNGIGNDWVWNSGTIAGGISLGSGDDLFQGGGLVFGVIDGSGGDDTIVGGEANDLIYDLFGSNWLAGGDGDDVINVSVQSGTPAVSRVFGGHMGGDDTSARDTISMGVSVAGANVFLEAGYVSRVSDGAVTAVFTGIENATGSSFADALIGSNGANALEGRSGADWLVGNGGGDTFVFGDLAHADSDQVRDLRRSEGDRIDLSGIDANSATTTNDVFAFRASHTSNAAGEAVITNFGTSARVDLYTNADNVVDGFFFVVYADAAMTNLLASDFVL